MRTGTRWVSLAVAALLAAPAYAAEAEVVDGELAGGPAYAAIGGPYAAAVPVAPILSATEGATDSGVSNIFFGALYGGLAGALIGGGVALIENDNWGRDIAIGAGAGILVGAVLGATHTFGSRRGPFPASDGLGTTARDPVIRARTVGFAGNF
jgi:hypothetical protein